MNNKTFAAASFSPKASKVEKRVVQEGDERLRRSSNIGCKEELHH
jgi:hypothetical protein